MITLCCLMLLSISAKAKNQSLELINDSGKCGWLIFGHGVMDSTTNCDDQEINIDVSWTLAEKGV